MIAKERHLFDDVALYRHCRRCNRKLHPAKRYRTRDFGLCFVCVRSFEKSTVWTVEEFLKDAMHEKL